MNIIPITHKEAKIFISKHHRHHKPPQGAIFCVGLQNEGKLVGVAMCGRPVARMINHKEVIEVNRLCLIDNIPNGCSKLYNTCSRIAKEMGYKKIITYILDSESGISLKSAGWVLEEENAGGKKWSSTTKIKRTDTILTLFGEEKKYPNETKKRYSKKLF